MEKEDSAAPSGSPDSMKDKHEVIDTATEDSVWTDRNTNGLAIVWAALFCDYLLMTIVIPIFPSALPAKSSFEIGVLFSSKAACQLLAAPFVASIVDGWGTLPIIIGLAVECISTVLFALTTGYEVWFAARAVQGIASSLVLSSGFLHVQHLFAEVGAPHH